MKEMLAHITSFLLFFPTVQNRAPEQGAVQEEALHKFNLQDGLSSWILLLSPLGCKSNLYAQIGTEQLSQYTSKSFVP